MDNTIRQAFDSYMRRRRWTAMLCSFVPILAVVALLLFVTSPLSLWSGGVMRYMGRSILVAFTLFLLNVSLFSVVSS